MSANNDSSPLQSHSHSKPLHLPHLLALALDSTVLLLTSRLGRRSSTYQPRLIVEHSWPCRATQPKGVLSPWDTPVSAMPLLRMNDFTPPQRISDLSHSLDHTRTPLERIGSSQMSSQAGHSKTSSSGRRQLTFSQQTSLSENIPDRLHTRDVGAAAVEELDSFHFGSPTVAKHVDGHTRPFGEITRVNNKSQATRLGTTNRRLRYHRWHSMAGCTY